MVKILCALCKKKCKGEVLKLGDSHYHANCFRCSICDVKLATGGFFKKDSQFLCSKDYLERHGIRCAICEQWVTGEVVTALGSTFHPACFKCSTCKTAFTAGDKVSYTGKQYLCKNCLLRLQQSSASVPAIRRHLPLSASSNIPSDSGISPGAYESHESTYTNGATYTDGESGDESDGVFLRIPTPSSEFGTPSSRGIGDKGSHKWTTKSMTLDDRGYHTVVRRRTQSQTQRILDMRKPSNLVPKYKGPVSWRDSLSTYAAPVFDYRYPPFGAATPSVLSGSEMRPGTAPGYYQDVPFDHRQPESAIDGVVPEVQPRSSSVPRQPIVTPTLPMIGGVPTIQPPGSAALSSTWSGIDTESAYTGSSMESLHREGVKGGWHPTPSKLRRDMQSFDYGRFYRGMSYLKPDKSVEYLKRQVPVKVPEKTQFNYPLPSKTPSDLKEKIQKEKPTRRKRGGLIERLGPGPGLYDRIAMENFMRERKRERSKSPAAKRQSSTEEPIMLSKFPGGDKPPPDEVPKIEREDFPAPPSPVYEARRRRHSGSPGSKSSGSGDEADARSPKPSEVVDALSEVTLVDGKEKRSRTRSPSERIQREAAYMRRMKEHSSMAKHIIRDLEQSRESSPILDPRSASRVPNADYEPHVATRYISPIYASPSRFTEPYRRLRSKSADRVRTLSGGYEGFTSKGSTMTGEGFKPIRPGYERSFKPDDLPIHSTSKKAATLPDRFDISVDKENYPVISQEEQMAREKRLKAARVKNARFSGSSRLTLDYSYPDTKSFIEEYLGLRPTTDVPGGPSTFTHIDVAGRLNKSEPLQIFSYEDLKKLCQGKPIPLPKPTSLEDEGATSDKELDKTQTSPEIDGVDESMAGKQAEGEGTASSAALYFPRNVNLSKLEEHLAEEEFKTTVFPGITKREFRRFPAWKQNDMKQKFRLKELINCRN